MGQRHQIFVKVVNPTKYLRNPSKEMKAVCGKGEFSILPFHNQWLFGRSALQSCLSVLNHVSQFEFEQKINDKRWSGYHTPFCPSGIKNNFYDEKEYISTINFIINFIVKGTASYEAGMLGAWFLGWTEPEMANDFRNGDNNDGITIIDTIENKYCFMNISDYGTNNPEKQYDVNALPFMLPVSAHDYVSAYYGETAENVNPSHYEGKNKTAEQVAKSHIKDNSKLVKQFKDYTLLTMDEVYKMFPLVKKDIDSKVIAS